MSNHHIKTVLAALGCKICDAFRGSVSRDVVFRISCGFCPSPEKGIFAVHGLTTLQTDTDLENWIRVWHRVYGLAFR